MMVRSVLFEFVDQCEILYRLLNAVWPQGCWGMGLPPEGRAPYKILKEHLFAWKVGKNSQEEFLAFAQEFWWNQEYFPVTSYSHDDAGEEEVTTDWQIVDEVLAPEPGVLHFVFNSNLSGRLVISVLKARYDSLHYTVKWEGSHVRSRDLIMTYLMTRTWNNKNCSYLTCQLDESEVTLTPEKALCEYFFPK